MPTDAERLDALEARATKTEAELAQIDKRTGLVVTQLAEIEKANTKADDDHVALAARISQLELDESKEIVSISRRIFSKVWGAVPKSKQGWFNGIATTFILFHLFTHGVGCVTPTPTPPDPIPTPTPIPPPTPTPGGPINAPGFRVLCVYDKTALTTDQQGIVYGRAVRDYLEAKCVQDGGKAAYRIYPVGIDTTSESQWIRETVQRHPGGGAWFVVSNGKTGYDGSIPANINDAMGLLEKYAEQPVSRMVDCGCSLGGICRCNGGAYPLGCQCAR